MNDHVMQMNVKYLRRKIIVDNKRHLLYINATSPNVRGNQNSSFSKSMSKKSKRDANSLTMSHCGTPP